MFPLSERDSKLDIRRIAVRPGDPVPELGERERRQIAAVVERIRRARDLSRPVVLTYGAHLIKNGLAPVVNRLIGDGWLTHIATNGAGSIHDWEFAFQGVSTEDVRANTATGRFGTWEETGRFINLAVALGGVDGLGYGASVGRMIDEESLVVPDDARIRDRLCSAARETLPDETAGALADALHLTRGLQLDAGRIDIPHPFREFSVQFASFAHGIPFTVHPGIGYDIIYTHPANCGGAIGRGSVWDFLSYADSISRLEGGVHLAVGSAVMAPMIFEKALSMANNLAIQRGDTPLTDYYLAVVDIQDGGGWDWSAGEPPTDNPAYYLRFCKSFYRMGGTLDYICLDNRAFVLGLCEELLGGSR